MPLREVAEQRLLLRDDEAEPEHERDLDELRRLELHGPDREPVGVAADVDAERVATTSSWRAHATMSSGHATASRIRSGIRLAMSMMGCR